MQFFFLLILDNMLNIFNIVMGENMASQADFGRGTGVGAASDVFNSTYCVVNPGSISIANQSFFNGCN